MSKGRVACKWIYCRVDFLELMNRSQIAVKSLTVANLAHVFVKSRPLQMAGKTAKGQC